MKKILSISSLILFLSSWSYAANLPLKTANVSGQFYSADPKELSNTVDRYVSAAEITSFKEKVELLIVPHAGYIYSGPVAAYGYKAISRQKISTVVIIAPSHYADFEGFAIWPEGSFLTPLGAVEVNNKFCQLLQAADKNVQPLREAFDKEHALEVQLPFLQKTFKNFKIVPLLTGRPNLKDCQQLAESLKKIIGGRDDILIVISSDMSHYYDGATADAMDAASLSTIKDLDVNNYFAQSLLHQKMEMCGFVGTTVALQYAELKGLTDVRILKHGNSGDATGEYHRVVGYGAVAFLKTQGADMKNREAQNKSGNAAQELSVSQKKRLIDIARKTIENYILNKKTLEVREQDPRLARAEGAFVTIHKHGQLRGCIGNIIGQGPLYQTVRDMAIAAATEDPRFSPVAKEELDGLEIEVSVLSEPKRITDVKEIEMGKHGVIVSRGARHGVFLPQVATETGWSREEFLSELCSQKAGLARDAWKDPQTSIEIFTAQVFSEGK